MSINQTIEHKQTTNNQTSQGISNSKVTAQHYNNSSEPATRARSK